MTKKKMIQKRSWKQFRESGLLWWVNRTLHLFGWAIVMEVDKDGKIMGAYPARSKFRGFTIEIEEANFVKLSRYLAKTSDTLLKEALE
jgi:hypothetical protein